MAVTPWKRLSDEVLAHAIQKFYKDSSLLPPGMPLDSIQGWASKMAYGLRLCVQRFRKIYAESPVGAKSKEVAALKARLVQLGALEPPPAGVQLSERCLSALTAPDALARMKKYFAEKKASKMQKAQPLPDESGSSSGSQVVLATPAGKEKDRAAVAGARRPVASVARAHRLPPALLEALQKQPAAPQPFATDGKEVEADETEDAPEEPCQHKDAKRPAEKKDAKPSPKKSKKDKTKAAKKNIDEAVVLPAPPAPPAELQVVPAPPAELQEVPTPPLLYEAGVFKDKKQAFIKRKRAETGMSYKDAQQCWMLCSERADLVGTLPLSEQKKRRFI